MKITALEERVSRLEQEITELRRENQSLRTARETTAVVPTENASLPRRDLLKGAAYALGAVSLSLIGTRRAEAATGVMQYGTSQHTDTTTLLGSSSSAETLLVYNDSPGNDDPNIAKALFASSIGGHAVYAVVGSGDFPNARGDGVNVQVYGTGHGVQVVKPSEFGHGVLAYQNSPASFYAAIAGVTKGAGPGLHGRGEGSGQGVWGQIADSTKSQSAVIGTTEGKGAAIEGNSILGRGGVFKGKKAALRLVASSAASKPSTGTRGDLFVDSSGRLWYCKTGGSTTGWVRLA